MFTNTKSLFVSILKERKTDCVCDIGSREGDQSLLFRHLLPKATVIAFEANPINFDAMRSNENLRENRIEIFPFAISDQLGTATFHLADVDYSDPKANRGTSSLLRSEGQKVKRTVQVETHRIDRFILERYPHAQRAGLWIDVEGAEHAVLDGASQISDRIVAIHVETSNEPRWHGQKPLRELQALLAPRGFLLCGRNFGPDATEWGDVVFIQQRAAKEMGWRFSLCKIKAYASYLLRADNVAVFLKNRVPWLYRFLRQLYIRFGT